MQFLKFVTGFLHIAFLALKHVHHINRTNSGLVFMSLRLSPRHKILPWLHKALRCSQSHIAFERNEYMFMRLWAVNFVVTSCAQIVHVATAFPNKTSARQLWYNLFKVKYIHVHVHVHTCTLIWRSTYITDYHTLWNSTMTLTLPDRRSRWAWLHCLPTTWATTALSYI